MKKNRSHFVLAQQGCCCVLLCFVVLCCSCVCPTQTNVGPIGWQERTNGPVVTFTFHFLLLQPTRVLPSGSDVNFVCSLVPSALPRIPEQPPKTYTANQFNLLLLLTLSLSLDFLHLTICPRPHFFPAPLCPLSLFSLSLCRSICHSVPTPPSPSSPSLLHSFKNEGADIDIYTT